MRHQRKSFNRRKPFKELRPAILIVCEGEKTEPNYFDDIKKAYGLTAVDIIICGKECGTNPKSVVKFAKEKKIEIERKKQQIYDVWCVFDCDQHEWIPEALVQAKDNKFQVAFSNPSFEIWYLLHYQEQTAHIERDKVVKKLEMHIPKYDKAMKGIFALLRDKLPVATDRAKKLRERHIGNQNPETYNPSTSVDMLVKYLQSISSK